MTMRFVGDDEIDGLTGAAAPATVPALDGRVDLPDVLHDLTQPLAAIRALASAPLADSRAHQDADELLRRLRQIGELGEWMNDLLRSGSVGQPDLELPGTADASRVVQDVVLAVAASYRGRLRWRHCGPAPVAVDSLELRRALGNLVDNATRAAGPRGRVEVRVRRSGRRVRVEVQDDGPGFGRLPRQSRRGLAVTQAMLDGCGGVLEIGRARSGGAVVGVELPLATAGLPA